MMVMSHLRILTVLVSVAAFVSAAGAEQVQKQSVPGTTNFSRVDATVACGGATTALAFPALEAQGFTSIVNLRQASEPGADIETSKASAESVGLKYIHLPFNGASPEPAIVDQFLKAVTDTANQPVYIHCASANRVGALWLVKRVLVDKWPVEKATAEARAIGLTSAALEQFALEYIRNHS